MAKQRICLCCGKSYEYCPNCGKQVEPGVTSEFDGESCGEIFNAVSAYNMKLIDAGAVKSVLKKYNVTDFSGYKKSVADVLREVNGVKVEVEVPTPKEEKSEPVTAPIPERTGFMKRDTFKRKNNEDKANT